MSTFRNEDEYPAPNLWAPSREELFLRRVEYKKAAIAGLCAYVGGQHWQDTGGIAGMIADKAMEDDAAYLAKEEGR